MLPSIRLRISVVCALAWVVAVPLAQTRQPFSRIAVTVTPDRPDWTYQPGEPVTFRIDVVRDGHQVAGDEGAVWRGTGDAAAGDRDDRHRRAQRR